MSFLKFTGVSVKEKEHYYLFKMEGKKSEDYIDDCINLPSPIIDSNFKLVFGNNPDITKSLLNSLLYPKDNNIIKVEYLTGELLQKITQFPEQVSLNSLDSIRADILCKCTLRNKFWDESQNNSEESNESEESLDEEDEKINLDEEQDFLSKKVEEENKIQNDMNKENIIIIDLEMQIGYNTENTRIYINYAKLLNLKYDGKIIVLSLVYRGFENPRKDKGFKICLGQKNFSDYKNKITYDDYVIYQIDLDYCRTLISKKTKKDDKNLWILNKNQEMNDSSKEWIKYLTLPIWCDESEDYYYIFPTLKENFFLTKYVYQAFQILIYQNDIIYYKNAQNQENKIKFVNNYIKIKKQNKELKKINDEKYKKIKDQQKLIDKLQNQLYGKKSGAGQKKNKSPLNHKKNKLNDSDSS